MSRLIFASHGSLSEGMLDSVKMIVGNLADGVETISLHPGESSNDLYQKLKEQVSESKEQTIILCDVLGGSVHTALSQLRQFENVKILSGMNMGLALALVLNYKKELTDVEILKLIENSKVGITLIHGNYVEDSDEDF